MADITQETSNRIARSEKVRRAMYSFFSGGRYRPGMSDAKELDNVTKHVLFNLFLLTGFAILLPITILIFLDPLSSLSLRILDCFFLFMLTALFFIARTKVPIVIPAFFLVLAYAGLVCVFSAIRVSGIASPLWAFILPLVAYYLLGDTIGGIITFITMGYLIFVFYTQSYYPDEFSIRVLIVYVFIGLFSLFSGRRLNYLSSSLMNSRAVLETERAELNTMKDNLDTGIFMLDANYEIQPLYSKSLAKIFEGEELENVHFPTLLANSLKQREIDLLIDYLGMVLVAAFDEEMLKEVNPLQKFSYMTKDSQEKILSINFAQISRDNNEKVLLATAKDITKETKLEEKLAHEEQFRQDEMKAMFEVMQVTPQVLTDFLDDLDYEFDSMNDMLKDKSRKREEVYRELYQGIHAVKSNAAVIGLESAAKRLHEFETLLQEKKDNPTADYETLLSVMFELERIMGIRDGLRDILDRLNAFHTHGSKLQSSSDFFLQSVRRTIKKAQENTFKEAVLKVNSLDWDSIDGEYRRFIKDIVMQFTRNALSHAIESSEERVKNGKSREGNITLSVKKNEGVDTSLVIEFADDGRGIDFNEIKKKVEENNLLPVGTDLSNNNTLIKAMFMHGFSTAESLSMQAGRGVGLSLVSDKVKKLKGTIKVQSKQNQGTKFTIIVPYSEDIRKEAV